MKLESPIKEQYKLLHHNPKQVARYIFQLLRAKLRGDMYGEERAVKELSRVIGESNVLANMLGRRRLLLEYNQFKKHWQPYRKAFLFGATPVIPSKTFDEALADLFSRPIYGDDLELGYEAVRRMYMGDHAFALAKTVDEKLTRRVQDEILKNVKTGESTETAKKGILTAFGKDLVKDLGNYAEAYAEVVYRTNTTTTFTEGRFQMAKDPVIAEIVGAMEYNAMSDPETRPNHWAAHGMIASVNDPIWEKLKPPLGYNCRCQTNLVDKFTLDRMGLIKPTGEVTRGWRTGPDKATTTAPARFSNARPDVDSKGVSFKSSS